MSGVRGDADLTADYQELPSKPQIPHRQAEKEVLEVIVARALSCSALSSVCSRSEASVCSVEWGLESPSCRLAAVQKQGTDSCKHILLYHIIFITYLLL